MTVRFRIRTSAGQELSFGTSETFEDFVRSGDMSPDDLVYDRETGSWAPARTHPLVLEIEYEAEEAEAPAAVEATPAEPVPEAEGLATDAQPEEEDEGAAATTDAAESEEPAGADSSGAFGLDLAPAAEMMSAEEAGQAFVEKMEAERENTLDFTPSDRAGIEGFTMADAETLRRVEPEAPTPEPPRTASRTPRPSPAPKREPSRPEARRRPGGRLVIGVLVVAGLGAGGYFGVRFIQGSGAASVPDSATVGDPVDTVTIEVPPPPPPPEPVIASTESAVRERAQERFLTSTQSLLRDLPPIPEVWPERDYLTLPSGHAEVLAIWQDYLTTIRTVRGGDNDRYRVAYEAALDDAAVQGDERGIRLSVAMSALDSVAALRDEHYDRVEALATAAIQSHNALMPAEGLILFDVTGATGVQDGIGLGTYGRDADSQLLLDQVLDLLSATLDGDGRGPGDGVNVREWVWDGFLEAVAN